MRPVQTPEAEFDWQTRDAAELAAFTAAVEEALADPRGIPHEEVEAWIRKVAAGDLSAVPPTPRLLR